MASVEEKKLLQTLPHDEPLRETSKRPSPGFGPLTNRTWNAEAKIFCYALDTFCYVLHTSLLHIVHFIVTHCTLNLCPLLQFLSSHIILSSSVYAGFFSAEQGKVRQQTADGRGFSAGQWKLSSHHNSDCRHMRDILLVITQNRWIGLVVKP